MFMARMLERVPPDQFRATLDASSSGDMTLQVDREPFFERTQHADAPVLRQLLPEGIVTTSESDAEPSGLFAMQSEHGPLTSENETMLQITIDPQHPPMFPRLNQRPAGGPPFPMVWFDQTGAKPEGMSVRMADGRWLNAAIRTQENLLGGWPDMVPLLASAILLILVVIAVVHLETRSLKNLAKAANRLGRGEKLDPLTETGPRETRAALRAFNQMGDRISRYVGDRTQMLAAMSHDLRTPLTTMRLRVEEMKDPELRDKLVSSIEEMKQMADATLAFARADAADEPGSNTNITDLAQCVVEEFVELGQQVFFCSTEPQFAYARPIALKRALRNLVENAVRYGANAEVSVHQNKDHNIEIRVADSGPGIPTEDMERVFEPFTRLESSRNRETGGAGLGLAIARSIVRSHGGELTLRNLTAGGLEAKISLQND